MKKIKESKCFCFHSYKTINYIYIIKYILLFLIDIFFKIFFSFFGKKIKKKKYYISICAIFKNEAPYMKEWIELITSIYTITIQKMIISLYFSLISIKDL